MAVHKRTYRAYEGALTPRWSRFLILTRYAARGVFQSRITTGLFVICFFVPLVLVAALYLNHNARLLSLMRIGSDHLMDIDGKFFFGLMTVQGALAFLMTAFIGPGMIAPDLANNALPLYFCRPLTRAEYVLGRACVILFILSLITWIPGLVLFGIESSLSGASWAWEHRNFAIGVFAGSWLWISVLALMALAISAWVRWKLIAGALLLGVMFATTAFAAAINEVLRVKAGLYVDPAALVAVIWANFFGVDMNSGITTLGASIDLAFVCCLCIWLLGRKIRAFEVAN
jgi:ABC-2 type transport system permease protein